MKNGQKGQSFDMDAQELKQAKAPLKSYCVVLQTLKTSPAIELVRNQLFSFLYGNALLEPAP